MKAPLYLRAATAIGAAILTCGVAHAQEVAQATHPHLVELTDQEMADARGGFEWGGMSITFGADMKTYIDGQLALQTLVSWTPTGAATQTTISNQLSQANLAALRAGGLALPATLAGSPVYSTASGQTAIVQGANDALQNILINTASNLNAVQQTNATVTLSSYANYASAMRAGLIGNALGNEVASFARH